MPSRKIDRAQRKAAGMFLLSLFAVSNTVSVALKRVTEVHPPSGGGTGAGLTDKEKEFVLKISTRYHDNGEVLRKLAWRFLK